MRRSIKVRLLFALVGITSLGFSGLSPKDPQAEAGKPKRTPWTTSRITGSPEPPHPYKIERVFPKLTFKNPLLLTMAPGGNRFFVGEQAGRQHVRGFREQC